MYYGTYTRLPLSSGIWSSDIEVIRQARKVLAPESLTRDKREARHKFFRELLEYHKGEQDICIKFRL